MSLALSLWLSALCMCVCVCVRTCNILVFRWIWKYGFCLGSIFDGKMFAGLEAIFLNRSVLVVKRSTGSHCSINRDVPHSITHSSESTNGHLLFTDFLWQYNFLLCRLVQIEFEMNTAEHVLCWGHFLINMICVLHCTQPNLLKSPNIHPYHALCSLWKFSQANHHVCFLYVFHVGLFLWKMCRTPTCWNYTHDGQDGPR